jgi:3-hydroxyacyl-CoA dehydrogenase
MTILQTAKALALQAAKTGTPAALLSRPAIPPGDPSAFETQKAKIRKRARGQALPLRLHRRRGALPHPVRRRRLRRRARGLHCAPRRPAIRRPAPHLLSPSAPPPASTSRKASPPVPLRTIGVLGGGTMGTGIASACLLSGLSVAIVERDEKQARPGPRTASSTPSTTARNAAPDTRGEAKRPNARSPSPPSSAPLADADLVIEAVFEDMDVKKAVFAELDA